MSIQDLTSLNGSLGLVAWLAFGISVLLGCGPVLAFHERGVFWTVLCVVGLVLDAANIAVNIAGEGSGYAYAAASFLHIIASNVVLSNGMGGAVISTRSWIFMYMAAEAIEAISVGMALESWPAYVAYVVGGFLLCLAYSAGAAAESDARDDDDHEETLSVASGGMVMSVILTGLYLGCAAFERPTYLLLLLPEIPVDILLALSNVCFEGGVGVCAGPLVGHLAEGVRNSKGEAEARRALMNLRKSTAGYWSRGGEYCWAGKWAKLAKELGAPPTILVSRKKAYERKLFSHRPADSSEPMGRSRPPQRRGSGPDESKDREWIEVKRHPRRQRSAGVSHEQDNDDERRAARPRLRAGRLPWMARPSRSKYNPDV